MRLAFVLTAFLCLVGVARTPIQTAAEIEEELTLEISKIPANTRWDLRMPKLQKRMDVGINTAIKIAVEELRLRGEISLAGQIEYEWRDFYGASLFYEARG